MRNTVREFIAELEAAGELRRVAHRVSPILEIAALADEESKKPAPHLPSDAARRNDPRFHHLGGRALLFEHVDGSEHPVLINAFGSYRRMEMAIGCAAGGFDAIAARIAELIKPEPPRSVRDAIGAFRRFAPLLRIAPKTVRRGACQEIVMTGNEVDLTRLPLLKCWLLDGDLESVGAPANINANIPGADLLADPSQRGRYITFAHIHTIHADDAGKTKPPSHNIGMYRVQLAGRRLLAMHWHMHHDGARHWRSWKARGERMPIAIVLGGESVLPQSGIAPLPPGISELLFAGFLAGRGIPMCPAKTVPLRVPANAEIVIEGLVSHESGLPGFDPHVSGAAELGAGALYEGPFGDHTGFYSLPDRYPLVEVTAITMRRRAIFPATIVGLPPQEDYFMGKAVERLFLPLFRTIAPDVVDYDLPLFGCFHNVAVLQIKKEYPLQGRRAMHSVWGAGQMAWTKCVIVVDHDVDVHDRRAVFRAIAAHCDPIHDMELTRGPLDILDHAAPELGAGAKIGFDATEKNSGERRTGGAGGARMSESEAIALREEVATLPGVRAAWYLDDVNTFWLLVQTEPGRGETVDALAVVLENSSMRGFAILVGAEVDIRNSDETLFHWLANMDPGRDRRDFSRGMIFDSRPKRPGVSRSGERIREWPPIIEGAPIGERRG